MRILPLALLLAVGVFAQKIPGRYIVELNTDSVVAAKGSRIRNSDAYAHAARIHAEQDQARSAMEQRGARVLDRVDTVANALIVDISDEQAAQLTTVTGVKRVRQARRVKMLLDRAAVQHKITEARSQAGGDRGGAGVKIAIIDSGIDSGHAGFQDASLTVPDSFPRVTAAGDLEFTNNKIIVARSYVSQLPYRDPDTSARDHVGHGTALAMVAAGVQSTGPYATISGVAPKAFLGSYKVFGTPGYNDYTSDDVILKAIDDAVADGMDIINLSLGSDLAPRLEDDIDVQAVERATKAGVIVVAAAGNDGPDLTTMSSPATALSAIAAGASTNDRTFAASVDVEGLGAYVAYPGSGASPSSPVAAGVVALDGDGLGCSTLPANSLRGNIALILRGSCTFEAKLNNAQSAGAVGAIVYAAPDAPDPFVMAVGAAALPAEMISNSSGAAIRARLTEGPSLTATLRFTLGSVAVPSGLVASFSAAGPNVDNSIKPDVLAVGQDIYVATQNDDPNGDMYDASGFLLVDGTSFSSPLIAGAAALLKSARPGLTVEQYRSLLINTAQAGFSSTVQRGGAGILDANAAILSSAAASPVSLSFGNGGSDTTTTKTVKITNVGSTDETYSVSVTARGELPGPAVSSPSLQLAPGASADVEIAWNAKGLNSGTYDGNVVVTSASTASQIRIPYWYAVTGEPALVTILDQVTSDRRGRTLTDAVYFRITDASGVTLNDVQPEISVVSGGGQVRRISSYHSEIPGLFGLTVRLGTAAGQNVFAIRVGEATRQITITGN